MKSYLLYELENIAIARKELSELLPGQVDPSVLFDASGDPVAYFNVYSDEPGSCYIQADISGRHYNEDQPVLDVLRQLQTGLGGSIFDDDDNQL